MTEHESGRRLPISPGALVLARETAPLASFPDVWFALRDAIEDPTSSLDDICRILMRDPALVAGLLRIANSAYFGYGRQVDTLAQAATLLGMFRIHDFVLATSVLRAFPRVPPDLFDMVRFWRLSLHAATAARQLAEGQQIIDSDRVFLLGLLAQIGRLVALLRRPGDCREMLAQCGGRLRELAALERARWGFDYAELGAALIDTWGLPAAVALPVLSHQVPGRHAAAMPVVMLVHVAVTVAVGVDANDDVAGIAGAIDSETWQRLALTPETFAGFVSRTVAEADNLGMLFVPP